MTGTVSSAQHKQAPIVALTSGGPHSWIMINALRDAFGPFTVIMEDEEPSSVFWKRRERMLGKAAVLSMKLAKIPMRLTKRRVDAVIDNMIFDFGLKPRPPHDVTIINTPSVNSGVCCSELQRLSPRAVFVVSTRMILEETLQSIDAPFINYHSGINPAYRGMYGGYFALANGEPEHFGTTVHLVDKGVDTGGILYQQRVEVQPEDNFHTYIWRMAAHSQGIVVKAMHDAINGELNPYEVELPSNQYFSPTFGEYVMNGLTKSVW